MELLIQVGASDEAELRSLHDWLLTEPGLVDTRLRRPPDGASNALQVALGRPAAGVVLAGSLAVWLQTRITEFAIKVLGAGGEVEVHTSQAADPEKVVELITSVLPEANRD